MKKIFILVILAVTFNICNGQKLGKYKYGTVDTVHVYYDAEIIVYKNKRDTIWFNKQTRDVEINSVNVYIEYSGNLKRPFNFSNHVTH